MGEFVDYVRGAGSPTQQLKLIGSFKPPALGVPEEAWDAAVYATLDRAAVLKRMVRADAETETKPGVFDGPAAMLVPRDRLGRAFTEAIKEYLSRPAATTARSSSSSYNNDDEMEQAVHVPLETRHTECLLSDSGRKATAIAIAETVETLLRRLG